MNCFFFFVGGGSDPQHFEDYKLCWIPMVEQRMPLVCFRSGSDEIVGANFTFVISEEDDYMHKCYERVIYYSLENGNLYIFMGFFAFASSTVK